MIDPELKYCPKCGDEYRADIEICASCEITLITGRDKIAREEARKQRLNSRGGELTPEDDIVALHKGPLSDIKYMEELLAAENIATLLVGDEQSCGQGCCPSHYILLVRREDAQDAVQIINAEHHRSTALEHHDTCHAESVYNRDVGQATCPACGHTFPTTLESCPDCGLSFG